MPINDQNLEEKVLEGCESRTSPWARDIAEKELRNGELRKDGCDVEEPGWYIQQIINTLNFHYKSELLDWAETIKQRNSALKDSERLDWVEHHLAGVGTRMGTVVVDKNRSDGTLWQCWELLGDGTYYKSGSTVRAAIDAAMSSQDGST